MKCIKKGEILKNSYEFNQLFFLEKGLCAYYINFYMNKPKVLIFDADFVSEWRAVPLVLSHEEYDEIINVSRVSISRIFARWRKKEVMRNQGRVLLIRSEFLSDVYD